MSVKHEDERRVIYDFAQGDFKSLKAVFVKQEIPIGDHYHLNKDEVFFLAAGRIKELTLGTVVTNGIDAPCVINVPRGLYHKFVCVPGSIIFGAATEVFDPKDELKT